MALDTSIYGNIKPVQIDSPVNMLAQVAQLRGAENQNRLFDMQVADRDQARQSDQAVRAAYALDDPTARSNALRVADPKAYREEQTFQVTQQKAQREAEKAQLEKVKQGVELQGQLLGGVKDQATWNQALQVAAQAGMDVSKFPQQYDPAFVQSAQQRALIAAQQVEQQWKAKGYDLDVAKFGETVRNNKTQNSIAQGNLGVAQANLGLKRQELAQGKVPSGYRANPDGTLSAIPGGPADTSTGVSAKPTADYLKQAEAYQNMDDAITGYTGILKNFGLIDAANPTKRAELDSAYQNALLQAKEIYKLGVLNGGDERIIKGVINRPLDLSSAFIPKEALIKQATDLQGIIKRGNENLAKVNKQKVVPLNSETAAATTPSASPQKAGATISVTNAADYAKVPSGALYVTPDGQTRKKP